MKTYIILGYARSGTSFLVSSLESSGVYIGRDFHLGRNVHGGFESRDFVNINQSILVDAGGGKWAHNVPPPEKDILALADKYSTQMREAIEQNKTESWGWKDPRTTLTIRLWMPHILEVDPDPFIYACFRKPQYAASSFDKRAKTDKYHDRVVGIAKEYNRRLFAFLNDYLIGGMYR